MPALLLILLSILISGCEAVAQNPLGTEARAVTPAPPMASRALKTRELLLSEGLIRDQTGWVRSTRCAEGQELAVSLDNPPACDELSIDSLGTTFRAFLFSRGHNELVIYHEGHNGCEAQWTFADTLQRDAAQLIEKVLQRADVLYFDMPLVATNCGQEIDLGGAVYSGTSHNWFSLLDKPGESALAYFFNHIHSALDYLGPAYSTVHMVGRSGGGWATTIYAALDWRISKSISVAGTLPLEFRGPQLDGRDDLGDWEQFGAYVFKLVKYQELYEAAGGMDPRRGHVQIYNEFDNCCFSGQKGLQTADDYSKSTNYYLQERVKFIVRPGETSHGIPVELVMSEIFGG